MKHSAIHSLKLTFNAWTLHFPISAPSMTPFHTTGHTSADDDGKCRVLK